MLRALIRFGSLALLPCLAAIPDAVAQSSASYSIEESSFNSGGHPDGGVNLVSASFRITTDSVGEGPGLARATGTTLRITGGFPTLNPPPVEVSNLRFNDATTLVWQHQPAAEYEVYRGLIASQPGTFGNCFATDITEETAVDASEPPVGAGYFYLVTARNLLGEESTKGHQSNGVPRTNPAPCP